MNFRTPSIPTAGFVAAVMAAAPPRPMAMGMPSGDWIAERNAEIRHSVIARGWTVSRCARHFGVGVDYVGKVIAGKTEARA